jgi:hypothetical protein
MKRWLDCSLRSDSPELLLDVSLGAISEGDRGWPALMAALQATMCKRSASKSTETEKGIIPTIRQNGTLPLFSAYGSQRVDFN